MLMVVTVTAMIAPVTQTGANIVQRLQSDHRVICFVIIL